MTKHTAANAANSAGHNRPPLITPDELTRDFGYIDEALAEIEAQVNALPTVCEDDEDLESMRGTVRRCVGAYKRLETLRIDVKEPFLTGERMVDSHFNKRKDKVAGWQSDIEANAKRYLDKKMAEEKAAREAEALRAAKEARLAAEAARKAEEDRIATEQAALAEVLAADAHDGAHYNAVEAEARQTEIRTREAALTASAEALKAQQAAVAKPAELARTRTGDGVSTLQECFEFEILDLAQIKLEELREFIPLADIEKAVRRHVAIHKDQRPLSGVRIYPTTKIRMT